jgi:RNA-directed DNA polymerase
MKKKLKRKNQPDSCKFYLSLSMRCVCQNIYAAGILYLATAYIKGLFDNVDHGWLIKFLGHDIADRNFLRLIKRFLKAGVMEEGKYIKSDVGTLQGGLISPILANIYLRYNLDLWFEKRDRRQMRGESYMIHYVDDFVCAFEYEEDARNFCNMLKERLSIFNLQIAEEKTKVIEFGRFAAANRKRKGEGKPGTFDFLGFTH